MRIIRGVKVYGFSKEDRAWTRNQKELRKAREAREKADRKARRAAPDGFYSFDPTHEVDVVGPIGPERAEVAIAAHLQRGYELIGQSSAGDRGIILTFRKAAVAPAVAAVATPARPDSEDERRARLLGE